MVHQGRSSFRWVFLSRPSSLLPEELPSPRRCGSGGTQRPAASTCRFGIALSTGVTGPATGVESDDVGLSPVSVVNHCVQAMPIQAPERSARHNRTPPREDSFPGLQQVTELSPPPRPNRDTSRAVFTWPLRRRSLPGERWLRTPSDSSERAHARPHCHWRGSSEDFRTGSDPHG